ncbi:putative spermidine/putrescine transport system substrate-binding protein [Thermocatellispora tengchongensis]|uniref:Putative spermidine/putrescine transport system substrate-binding protein n=1 Tax=Thermocatellispora tengchongensis TaxID=1073253 RepID=A0A840P9X3_9ACTN|nr:extracellular solute-binding protein [Thermocatellispora tengchongensis]MBB5135809.1 putative spermidine/putrescine transport system substrate-binding protein [Thermocatellispora tengchongensis]
MRGTVRRTTTAVTATVFGRVFSKVSGAVPAVILAVVLVVALTACGHDPSAKGGRLTVTAYTGTWGEQFRTSIVAPFERDTGARVDLVHGADAEWLTRLRAAGGRNPPYDVIAFTPGASGPAAATGLLQPLDIGRLEHYNQLDDILLGKAAHDGEQYGVPLTTGSTGLTYRRDKVARPDDWDDIFDAEYCGRVALPPLTYQPGLDFFTALVEQGGGRLSDPAAVDRAFERLKGLRGCVSSFPEDAGAVVAAVRTGTAWIVPFWDGRAFAMEAAGVPVGFSYPASGPVGALTSYFIAEGTARTDLAYMFLNHLSAAETQRRFAESTWYAAANDDIEYSREFEERIAHGPEIFARFKWVDYAVAAPKLEEWQRRWDRILR